MKFGAQARVRVVLVLTVSLLSTGCWDRVETNDLAIVGMAGMDRLENGQLLLSVDVVVPSRFGGPGGGTGGGGGGGGGQAQSRPVVTLSASGVDVAEAVSRLQMQVPRRLFWGQMRELVLGEAFARSGVRADMDFWLRHRQPRLTTYVVVVPGQARAFLDEAWPALRNSPVEAIREVIRLHYGVEIMLRDFLEALGSDSQDPTAPRFELVTVEERAQARREVQMTGTALFRDDKLVGWLDMQQTRGLAWLRGEAQRGTVTDVIEGRGTISFVLVRSQARLTARLEGDDVTATLNLLTEDDVEDNGAGLDLSKPEEIARLELRLAKRLEDRIRSSFQTITREYGADPMGLGEALRRADPRAWDQVRGQWHKLLPEARLEVVVAAHIRRTGKASSPVTRPKGSDTAPR